MNQTRNGPATLSVGGGGRPTGNDKVKELKKI